MVPFRMAMLLGWLMMPLVIVAQESESTDTATDAETETPLAGHSGHGEVFNEGPRQRAYLMEGMAEISFPITSDHPEVQAFMNQGVAQLHGFWYFEAERSFRQAAALDPSCAITYWGMAMANMGNASRAKDFIAEAKERIDQAGPRERRYIEMLDAYLSAEASNSDQRKKRAQDYAKALERLVYEFPDDLDAKAWLALQLWKNRSSGLPLQSFLAVDALLEEVFRAAPMHPAHHYRIHLWDYERPQKAVEASALCGPSTPGIAHMWHMPGHIYSRLKRYNDAAWQQEASARVDHAHMMRDRVMPDQIHNFAHNNEWLIRNLLFVGRVSDALDLAMNMIELPRHPRYNTLARRGGSASYGRQRLLNVLTQYELWEKTLELSETPYLEATDAIDRQTERLRAVGRAHWHLGHSEAGTEVLNELRRMLDEQQAEATVAADEAEARLRPEEEPATEDASDASEGDETPTEEASAEESPADSTDEEVPVPTVEPSPPEPTGEQPSDEDVQKARESAKRPWRDKIRSLEQAIQELEGWQAVAAEDWELAVERLKAARVDAMWQADVRWRAGEEEEAIADAIRHADGKENEVRPLALLVAMLHRAGQVERAREYFEKLRELSAPIDLGSPVFARLCDIAVEFGYGEDWRVEATVADDLGDRPHLDTLGPFRWSPSSAPRWSLPGLDGKPLSLEDYQGRPVVVIFFLGYGCLHCAEQLHAFAPRVEDFRAEGIEIVAISSDDEEGLRKSVENYTGGPLPIPLVADPDLASFHEYRCYDDFEGMPLHGTFLIDPQGMVLWQDISYEPFNNPDFVLEEAVRLLTAQQQARSQ